MSATTATVNGKLILPDGTAPPAGSFVQLDLKNYGTAQPQVSGVVVYPQKVFNLSSSDGTWSGTLYRNDAISVNGTFPTYWAMTYFTPNGPAYAAKYLTVAQDVADLDTLTALNPSVTLVAPSQPLIGGQSASLTVSLPLSTWTLAHNFGTQAVVAQCYDSSWHQIIPDTATATDNNTFTATFVLPQTGFMVCFNVGNWTPSITNPNYVVQNPSSSQTIAGDYPFTFGGSINTKRLEGIRFADQFGSLAAAYADLPISGGTVIVPSGYSETLSANLTLNKANSGFLFLGQSVITMGTNQLIVPAGTHGVFIDGMIAFGGSNVDQGAVFNYTGTGSAILAGGSSVTTRAFRLSNILINLTGNAKGISLLNVVYFKLDCISIFGNNTVGSIGIYTDGTGNFTGTGTIINPLIAFVGTCISCTNVSMNAVTILGGTLQPNTPVTAAPNGGGIGLDFQSAESNFVLGTDIESAAIAVKFGANAINNYVDFRSESNTNDVTALSGASFNVVRGRRQPAQGSALVVSDAGTSNHFYRPIDGDFDTITNESGIVSKVTGGTATLTANSATTSQKFIQLANTGHTGFYYGIESSVGGAFFTGSNAYEAVLYSPTNNLFIKSPLVRFSGTPVIAGGAAPTVAAGQVGLGTTTATSATAGANGAVPAQVAGYLIVNIGGTNFKVPYFPV